MILVDKREKDAILERFPDAKITRTVRQKSKRHRYYCEETRHIINFLNKYKREHCSEMYFGKKEGARHRNSKKRK